MFKYAYSADEWAYHLYIRHQRINYPFNRPTLKETMLRREQDFVTRYGARSFAMEYYHKALRAARDEKFIEEMLTMMRKCAESPTMMNLHRYHFRNVVLFPKTDFYHTMMRYTSTAAYRELLEESPSFQDYVRLHK
jgi:hypothetical protein